ncbi:AIPR protein [Pseudoflavitalea sp. X16]|uniref:AIPR family protein n=1 Tax=Paraflavitalea devenefica TaxID=2716334 RepID=UPI0014230E4C|nr:AIPR family protein [Paraflavitalea devenefica]NII26491.1 AIPR protein [Paraflavitalea devenefica]
MTKFETLINILDTIIKEAPASMSSKYPKKFKNSEEQNQARSRAFIHLYLKVSFGLLDFIEREHFVTDGSYDGGIDGYFINKENRTAYFIQSKFRTNGSNFETKEIALEEVLVMDVNRILDGEEQDETGKEYNGKIKQLQREISTTENIARYSNQVIILANLSNIKPSDLRKLTGGFATEIFNYEQCYDKLVFPVITGTFFNATDLNINIDLSNKNAGSKISYTVQTKKGECEITVLFVPTIELGRIMYKYKNSILKYNPRSYLGHEGKHVNNAIRETIIEKETNEFALFNNGITMLSDETYINEKIGQKNKAQLIVKNPQIINGGQTSYTLSRIYEENITKDVESVFKNKEVLLKVITLLNNKQHESKLDLINDISEATNKQTPVINADKMANEKLQVQIQKFLFDKYGLLYERKRGEFADGIFNGYIPSDSVMERNLFFRMFYCSNGRITKAREKKLFLKQGISFQALTDSDKADNAFFGYLCFRRLNETKQPTQRVDISTYAKVYVMTVLFKPTNLQKYKEIADNSYKIVNENWEVFLEHYRDNIAETKTRTNKRTGEVTTYQSYNYAKWFESDRFMQDILNYFSAQTTTNKNITASRDGH